MKQILFFIFMGFVCLNSDTYDLRKLGTDYAGFYYPAALPGLDSDSVIYCFGAGEDISHDLVLAGKLSSKVYIFDPTPRAMSHVQLIKDVLDGEVVPKNSSRYGGADPDYWNIILNAKVNSSHICFYPDALYTEDVKKRFYFPRNRNYVSYSILPSNKSKSRWMWVQCKKISTFMEELGHEKIDVLKIDIEGVECQVLDQMLDEGIFPKYISVDFDSGWCMPPFDVDNCFRVIERLKSVGYEVLHSDKADWSFIRVEERCEGTF